MTVVGRVLAEPRVFGDVVRAHDPLAREGRAEHLGVARHGEVGELGAVDPGQHVEGVAFALRVDDVVEERAELRAGQLHARVDHRLHQAVEIQFGGHLGGRGVQHLQRMALLAQSRLGRRQRFFRLLALGDVEDRADEADRLRALEHRPSLGRNPALRAV